MFSETIFIKHSAGAVQPASPLTNGHHQNGSREEVYHVKKGTKTKRREDRVRSYYESHLLERLHSDTSRASPARDRNVNCFVRSEIKWVFLKSLKVRAMSV